MSRHAPAIGLVLIMLVGMADSRLPEPTVWMEQVATQLFAALDPQASSAAADLEGVMHDNVDFAAIAGGVMGQHRARATTAQRARFQRMFEHSVVELLRSVVDDIGDYQLSVGVARIPRADRAQVPVLIATDGSRSIDMQFSIAAVDGRWQVRNVIVAGVNLGVTFRNQFDELMKSRDGDLDAAIDAWQQTMQSSTLVDAQ